MLPGARLEGDDAPGWSNIQGFQNAPGNLEVSVGYSSFPYAAGEDEICGVRDGPAPFR